jgi:hypothetical protein
MYNLEENVSIFVENQFPDFYKEEGPLFILFAKEYYKWLESNYVYLRLSDPFNFNIGDRVIQTPASGTIENVSGEYVLVDVTTEGFRCTSQCLNSVQEITSSSGGLSNVKEIVSTNPLFYSRKLFSYSDIDHTTDSFLIYFKEKYLKGIQFDTFTSKRMLVKAAKDLYSSKGTERSIDLLFKLVFGVGANVYYPGDDIFKLSSGQWRIPQYLEVTFSPRTVNFLGKEITGSISGARGFCEYIIKRNINGKIIDIIYLSNVRGTFVTGDLIVQYNNLALKDAPKVVGSLTKVDITIGGSGFETGELVDIVGSKGVNGKAVVTGIETQTGLVKFKLIDGGWGYSNSSLIVSDKVLGVNNRTNANTSINDFIRFETISQDLYNVTIDDFTANGTIFTQLDAVGSYLVNEANNTALVSKIVSGPANNSVSLLINRISGDILSNSQVRVANLALITTIGNTSAISNFSVSDAMVQSNGSANVSRGNILSILDSKTLTVNVASLSSNGIHAGYFIKQATTNTAARVLAIPWSSGTSYNTVPKIVVTDVVGGTLNTLNIISLYSDKALTNLSSTFYITSIANTKTYKLGGVSGNRWHEGNIISSILSSEINTILVASEISGTTLSSSNVTAVANIISVGNTFVGVNNPLNTFISTPGNKVIGAISNTYGEINFLSAGTNANVSIISLLDTEHVRICLDFLAANNDGSGSSSIEFPFITLNGSNSTYGFISSISVSNPGTGYSNTNKVVFSGGNAGIGSFGAANASITTNSSGAVTSVVLTANVGSGYIATPNVAIVNSTGGSTGVGTGASLLPAFPLGFFKLAGGDMNTPIINLLRFDNRTIGKIGALGKFNPGKNYNIAPPVTAYEYGIAELSKKDFIISIYNLNGSYQVGELVVQTSLVPSAILNCNTISGNSQLQENHIITQSNGSLIVASGEIHSFVSNTASNSFVITVKNIIGEFSNSYNIINTQTNGVFKPVTASTSTLGLVARGVISQANSTQLKIKRHSLFNEFLTSSNNNLIGFNTLSNSAVLSVVADDQSASIGDNATVTSNVVSEIGSLTSISLTDSGFGYEDNEGVKMVSAKGIIAEGKCSVTQSGIGAGYYLSRDGFLSDTKKIHDGEYYQDYSYEVQSPIPLDKYSNILKQVLHVAGTKFFGKVKLASVEDTNITALSSITLKNV